MYGSTLFSIPTITQTTVTTMDGTTLCRSKDKLIETVITFLDSKVVPLLIRSLSLKDRFKRH
jgi:hypothetical protein